MAETAVAVTFTVTPAPQPALIVDPDELILSARSSAGVQSRLFSVRTEGDPGPITAAADDSPWLAVTTRSSSEEAAVVTVQIDPATLADGLQEGSVRVQAGSLTAEVPVRLTVQSVDYVLSHSGLTFNTAVGAPPPARQELRILNRNPEPLAWTASPGAPWVRVEPPTGSAAPASRLDVSVDGDGLEPGVHSSWLTVTPQAGGAAQRTEIRLNLTPGSVRPEVSPAGLVFRSDGADVPAAQQIMLSNGGAAPLAYVLAVEPEEAASWLAVGPPSGIVPAGGAIALTTQASAAGLAAGGYHAHVTVEFADSTMHVVDVMLLVSPAACEPTGLMPMLTKLGDHFRVRPGWPVPVEVLVSDDCGRLVSDGAGLLEFSTSGEPALPLIPGPDGLWTTTWTPSGERSSITATVRVENATGLLAGSGQVTGAVEETN